MRIIEQSKSICVINSIGKCFLSFIILTFSAITAYSENKGFTHRLDAQSLGGTPERIRILDSDNNGFDELFYFGYFPSGTNDAIVRYDHRNDHWVHIWQLNLNNGEKIEDIYSADLDQDDVSELILAVNLKNNIRFDIYESHTPRFLRVLATIATPDFDGNGYWDGRVNIHKCYDFNNDGYLDVVITLNAGFDFKPRDIIVLSGLNGDVVRSYSCSGPIDDVQIISNSVIKNTEILFKVNAVNNGIKAGIFDDSHIYLIALDSQFEMLWWKLLAGYSESGCYTVADLDNDGNKEVIYSVTTNTAAEPTEYRVEIANSSTGEISRYLELRSPVTSILTGDINRDSTKEIIIGQYDGTITQLDKNLETVNSYHGEYPITVRWFGDLDYDGSLEIAATSQNNTLTIFDRQLNPIAQREIDNQVDVVGYVRSESFNRMLVLKSTNVSTITMRDQGFSQRVRADLTSKFIWAGFGLILGSGLTMIILQFRSRNLESIARHRELTRIQNREELLSSLAAFGHSGMARSNLERLAQYSETIPVASNSKSKEFEQRFFGIIRNYEEYTRGLLEKIRLLAKDQIDLKSELENMILYFTKLDSEIQMNRFADGISEATPEKMKIVASYARSTMHEIRTLRKKILSSIRTDVSGTVCRVVASESERLRTADIENCRLSLAGNHEAIIDEKCLMTCLEIIITNAVEAMVNTVSKNMDIKVSQNDNFVIIRVSDTGCGIAEKDWERIFEREVTTKGQGHGLGLYYARMELSKYSGTLRVESSRPEQETVLALKLLRTDDTN